MILDQDYLRLEYIVLALAGFFGFLGVIEALDKDRYDVSHVAIDKSGNWLTGENARKYLEIGTSHKVRSQEMKDFLNDKKNAIGEFANGEIDGKEKKMWITNPV